MNVTHKLLKIRMLAVLPGSCYVRPGCDRFRGDVLFPCKGGFLILLFLPFSGRPSQAPHDTLVKIS